MTGTIPIADRVAELERWLYDDALPRWRGAGFDPRIGFYETVALDGAPTDADVRSRVNPRQVYCFAQAGRRGWQGDWRNCVEGGLRRFDAVYRRPDGVYGHLATVDGTLIDDRFDLYNQAFALLAFAATARAMPERTDEMEARARALLSCLDERYRHPRAGFEEAAPPAEPLRSNPHMHLFEAFQAWERVPGADPAPWAALADEIAGLALDRLIDGETGALLEYFAQDWSPISGEQGRVVEPGHQFEWAWLLTRWAIDRGRLGEVTGRTRRLFEIGETKGIDPKRDAAVMQLDTDFRVTDPVARLWAQAEWLKAAVLLAAVSSGEQRRQYLASAERAAATLSRFLDVPLAGLWYDKLQPDGSFADEPSPASSFYHIVCAIGEAGDWLAETED